MAVYFMQPTSGGPVKIGCSVDVDRRRIELETAYGCPLVLLATMEGDRDTEAEVHERFAHLRLGRAEQFRPAPDLMAFIRRPLLASPDPYAVTPLRDTGANSRGWERKPLIAALWGSQPFKAWTQALAGHDRNTVAGVIERALVHYAKAIGFSKEAPER